MTLNLMLTSRSAVFLSGDFRLTYPAPRPPIDDLNAQKLIPAIRWHWSALIAFTGVATTSEGLDVGDWIESQVAEIPSEAPFDELPNRLRSASSWLSRIGRGEDRLAMSIVGFVNRRPFAMVISNFTDLFGRLFPRPLPSQLAISEERPKEPRAFVPGGTPVGLASELERLKSLLGSGTPPRAISNAMAEANRAASDLSQTISKECVTGFLLASGAGEITPHAIPEGRAYVPSFVQRQLVRSGVAGFTPKYDENGVALPPRWVGMTAKVENQRGKPWAVGWLHAMRNVAAPIGGKPDPGVQAFWKVATSSNEPPVTFTIKSLPP